MKWLSGASVILALAVAAPAAEEEFKTSSYYPMQVGATWNYQADNSKFTATVKTHHEVLVGGQKWQCAHVEITQDGKAVGSEDVSVQEVAAENNRPAYRGVFRVLSDDKAIEPPVLILKEPPAAKPGEGEGAKFNDVWTVSSKAEPKGAARSRRSAAPTWRRAARRFPGPTTRAYWSRAMTSPPTGRSIHSRPGTSIKSAW